MNNLKSGTVYTETIIWSPPQQFFDDAPYQLAIIAFAEGNPITARIDGDRLEIGDQVSFLEYRESVPYFQKVLSTIG